MIKKYITLLAVTLLISCGATHTMLTKRNLEVKTSMSDTIFLEPVAEEQQTIFLQVRNSSGVTSLDLSNQIKQELIAKGYQIMKNPKEAQYILQANVLYCDKTDLKAMQKQMGQGMDSAILGGLVASTASSVMGNSNNGSAALIGAGIGFVADSLVEDVSYSIVTDVLISEKTDSEIKSKTTASLKTGRKNNIEQTNTKKTNVQKYQTKIVSSANKVNLKLADAIPELVGNLSRSIVGIF